jgi:hypothetical protein
LHDYITLSDEPPEKGEEMGHTILNKKYLHQNQEKQIDVILAAISQENNALQEILDNMPAVTVRDYIINLAVDHETISLILIFGALVFVGALFQIALFWIVQ